MKAMLVIDADAHVMEPEDAFAERYFEPAYRDRRPRIVVKDEQLYWLVDDQIYPRLRGARGPHYAGIPPRYRDMSHPFTSGCDWIPFMLDQMDNFYNVITKRLGWRARNLDRLPTDYIRSCDRVFFNTEPESKILPLVLEEIGNKFVLGSDMPHTETVDRRSKQKVLLERTDISAADARAILETNPMAYFRVKAWERITPRALAGASQS